MRSLPTVIVLAAGRGSRFGSSSNKLTQSLGPLSVLGTTLSHALASQLPVLLVTTVALATEARALMASRDIVVLPPEAAMQGMGYSMAMGVGARPHAGGWVMLPGDMPMVRPETIRSVAQELMLHAVTYPQHLGRMGRPLGFGPELYSELVTLKADDAARRLCARYPAFGVDVNDPGVLMDVDTSDDLLALRQSLRLPVAPPLPRSPEHH